MPTVTWLIKKNADAPVTLSSSGVTACVLSLKANGVDSLTFVQSHDWVAAPAWPFGSTVALIRRTVDGEVTTDRCFFVGKVESIPRQSQGGGSQDIRYTALGPAYALQLCDYSQEWTYTADDGTTAQIYEPTVVLGEDNNGLRLTSGGVINHAASYAVARGVQIDIGTIAAGVTVPLDERDNIKVWDAVVSMLRYTPDYVLWFDYNHQVGGAYVPALNVTAPADMQTVVRGLDAATAAQAAFTPRYDIRVPGMLITYRWTGDWDGQAVKKRVVESAGVVSDPRRVSLVYDLDGVHASFITQDVEVVDYPANWITPAGEAFVLSKIPRLPWPKNDNWWEVKSVTRSGTKNLPAMLVNGAVPEWTGKETEDETFTVEVDFQSVSADTGNVLSVGTQKMTFKGTSTDAVTKTYRKMTEWVEPEPVPAGLASALLESWNRLHYDGQVIFHGQECDFGIGMANLLSCTGGLLEWETMAAVVQAVDFDLGNGTTTVTTGTCGRLEADNLLAIYRAARGRRHSYSRVGRDNPSATDGNQVEGAITTPNDVVSDGTPPCMHKRFAIEARNEAQTLHRVDINPAALMADLTNPENTAQVLTLRPIELIQNDGPDANGNARISVFKAYALMSEPGFDRHVTMSDIPESSGGVDFQLAENNGLVLDATTSPATLKLVGTDGTAPASAGTMWGYKGAAAGYGWVRAVYIYV